MEDPRSKASDLDSDSLLELDIATNRDIIGIALANLIVSISSHLPLALYAAGKETIANCRTLTYFLYNHETNMMPDKLVWIVEASLEACFENESWIDADIST